MRDFGSTAGGWSAQRPPRMVVDVTGDDLLDVVGFGSGGIRVAANTGGSFAAGQTWLTDFGYTAGDWRVDQHPRLLR